MTTIGKRAGSLFLWIALLAGMTVSAEASGIPAGNDPAEAVYAIAEAVNTKDWDTYISLWCSREQPSFRDYLSSPSHIENHSGVYNVRSEEIVEIRALSVEDAWKYLIGMDLYKERYGTLAVYYVGADLKTYREDDFHFDGVNYFTYVLGIEDGQWRILEISCAPASRLADDGFGFGSLPEAAAIARNDGTPLWSLKALQSGAAGVTAVNKVLRLMLPPGFQETP